MNISKFTQKSIQAIQDCEKYAYEYGNQEIAQEHFLYALLKQDDSSDRETSGEDGNLRTGVYRSGRTGHRSPDESSGRTGLYGTGSESGSDPCRG